MERDDRIVPEPLIDEIAGFIGQLSPRLHRRLRRNRSRNALSVLGVLFDAEAELLPKDPHFVDPI